MVLQTKPVHPPSRSPRSGARATGTPRTRRRHDGRPTAQRSRRSAPPPSPRTSPAGTSASLPDPGVRVMLVFTAATLIMVAAVALVGAVGQWWVLVPVMLVDFILTFIVLALFAELLGEGD